MKAPVKPQPVEKKTEQFTEVGFVTSINDYIITVQGLPNIRLDEIVISENKALGLVAAIKDEQVEILMLDDIIVKPKEIFRRTNKQLYVSAGSHLLGRAINPLGVPIDGKGGFAALGQATKINQGIPGIKHRDLITDQFETGTTVVDTLVPLALGQRELIIGDSNSGKSEFLIDTIVSQKSKKGSFICIYAMIGKPINVIKNLMDTLGANGALPYTAIVATSSSEKATIIYLTPSVAIALAEYFQKRGKDVLLILDDLGLHAKYYREIALLSGKPPGRDSYPGDIFFQHARLIERAGRFNQTMGGGSITCLPVIETQLDDFTNFMTTNLMGMTDGHLLFSSSRFKQGIRPPIDVSLSVSRVGRQTQNLAQKFLADRVKALMSEAIKLENYSKFGSEISPQTRFILKQAKQVEIVLNQAPLTNLPIIIQMILLGLIFTPFFGEKELDFVETSKNKIIKYLETSFDLKNYQQMVVKFKDDKEFLDSLNQLIPQLQKVC